MSESESRNITTDSAAKQKNNSMPGAIRFCRFLSLTLLMMTKKQTMRVST